MDVILLQDVEKLGLKGDVVGVKRGYARNYLLPRRLAEVATAGRVAEIRRVDAARAQHEARSAEQAQEIAGLLGRTVLRFEVKAGPTGSLFGSVTASNVADELWRTRKIRVDKRKIEIEAIKKVGRYFIPVHVYEGVVAEVKTLVVPEGGDLTEEELAAITAQDEAAVREAEAEKESEAAAAAAADAAAAAEAAVAEALAEREAAEAAVPASDLSPAEPADSDERTSSSG
jgi:large subunit ribosomal protein L9